MKNKGMTTGDAIYKIFYIVTIPMKIILYSIGIGLLLGLLATIFH